VLQNDNSFFSFKNLLLFWRLKYNESRERKKTIPKVATDSAEASSRFETDYQV